MRKETPGKKEKKDLKSTPSEPSLLKAILSSSPKKTSEDLSETDVFRIFSTRRSTRKFSKTKVEEWKIDKILAAADTAPTAGNFQGLKIFYVKNKNTKQALVEAANKQPYVNAPVVLVFCMDPSRVKLKFPPEILEKFSLQDATLAASYSQIAATGLGLSSIWIGMLDEKKVQDILGTDLRPSSILCIGYPDKKKPPKSRRKLKELIEVVE
ncbi:MAG: nitroreductase family protein [Nitrosopumilaceae archaeon]